MKNSEYLLLIKLEKVQFTEYIVDLARASILINSYLTYEDRNLYLDEFIYLYYGMKNSNL